MPKKKKIIIAEDDLDIARQIFSIARRSRDVDDVAGAIAEIIAKHRRTHWVKGWDACHGSHTEG